MYFIHRTAQHVPYAVPDENVFSFAFTREPHRKKRRAHFAECPSAAISEVPATYSECVYMLQRAHLNIAVCCVCFPVAVG